MLPGCCGLDQSQGSREAKNSGAFRQGEQTGEKSSDAARKPAWKRGSTIKEMDHKTTVLPVFGLEKRQQGDESKDLE